MGKLLNSLLLVVAVELSLNLFIGATTPATSLLLLIFNLNTWTGTTLITKVITILAGAGIVGIVVGTFLVKSDFIIFGGFALMFLSYGAVFMQLFQYLQSGLPWLENSPITILILTPIIILYIYTVLKFWRGWD